MTVKEENKCSKNEQVEGLTDLLGAPLITQGAKLIRVCDTDLVQRCQITGQVCPKVLCRLWEFRNVLQTKWMFAVLKPFSRSESDRGLRPVTL